MPYLKNLTKIVGHPTPVALAANEVIRVNAFHEDMKMHSQLVYRGITKEFALDRFVISDASGGNLGYAAEQIFYFGEKANACLKGKSKYLPTLRDVTLSQLLCLTGEVNSALNGDQYDKAEFVFNNPDFFDYFAAKDISDNIKTVFSKLNKNCRIKLRNMLISFLHTHGENAYKSESALVSTSTSFDFAYNFIENKANGNEFVILLAWLPQPEPLFAIRAALPNDYYSELQVAGIPTINTEIYDFESEVSVMGALFPHFIFGIYDPSSTATIVNHHILSQSRSNQGCALNGLMIDQSTFKKKLKDKTIYHDGVELQQDGIDFL